MTEEIKKIIQTITSDIFNIISDKNIVGDTEGLFSKFVLSENSFDINWNVACNNKWITEHASEIKQGNHMRLASLGYSIKSNHETLETTFREGFSQLMKRDAFPLDRISFVFYPRIFLGIILGVKSMSNSENEIKWLREVLKKRQEMDDFDEIHKLLYRILDYFLNDRKFTIEHSTIESFSNIEEFTITYWAIKNSIFVISNAADLTYIKKSIMNKIVLEINLDNNLLPFGLFAINNIVTETTDSVILTIDHISKILGNFESAMERWTWKDGKQWKIENEYDVQNILYLILRSVFDDTEYEDPTQKFGSSSSRLDLKIPSQEVIVEAKFARKESDFKKIEDEIKIDSIDYIKSTSYKKIIVFIYDDSSSVQLHQRTVNALKQIESIHDVIVASKPSHMKN